ncbi:MAG: hypothetical protein IPJ39_17350 [Saprospiraceae bacterium]|nr:hypothetical protein [Saprospiraceae bacterium]
MITAISATAICAIDIDDLRSNHPNDRIAFFVGSELRGLGTPVHIGNGVYRHFVTFIRQCRRRKYGCKNLSSYQN